MRHAHVIVDDEIEDGIENVILAVGKRRGRGLASLPHRKVRGRVPVANGDDIAATDEQMRFAEDDFVILHMRSPGDDEHRVPINLQLRALVGLRCILDRQRMEIELGLDLVQQHFIRLVQADPDDGILPASPFAGLFDPDVPNALPMMPKIGPIVDPMKLTKCAAPVSQGANG